MFAEISPKKLRNLFDDVVDRQTGTGYQSWHRGTQIPDRNPRLGHIHRPKLRPIFCGTKIFQISRKSSSPRLRIARISTMISLILGSMAIWHGAQACVASGICGGGLAPSPCYSPIPPVAPTCAGGVGCAPGMACGSYGCYRRTARALSAATFTSEGAVETVSQRQVPAIFGKSRYTPLHEQNVPPPQPPVDPNTLFMACCEQRGLPDACLQKCTFNTYTKEALTRMYFKQDGCPLAASADIQFCAAQGRDHRQCCARNGVTTTLAGGKCLTFCDQRPGNVTLLDYSYISCYERFENMKSCFWYDAVNRFV
ncbi:unnamed protein product, partial [Mesorhabditis belari]|uniref:Domain of unknown function DB domain-containing protein n=1 Tax=Mesorhabditis belari TaxID=2138241 RepID=A0AAF3EY12_9BILA